MLHGTSNTLHSLFIGLNFFFAIFLNNACSSADTAKKTGISATPLPEVTITATPSSTATPAVSFPTPSATNYSISVSGPTLTSLTTKDTSTIGEDTICTDDITITVKSSGVVQKGVDVTLSIVANNKATNIGAVEPTNSKTNEQGIVTAKYCSGDDATDVSIAVKAGSSSANSGVINITEKPTFTFTYKGTEDQLTQQANLNFHLLSTDGNADAPTPTPTTVPSPTATPDTGDKDNSILLNLFGAGTDCIVLLFEARQSGKPYVTKADFKSQDDYPVGSKLALRADNATSDIDPKNGRKFLTYLAAQSDGGGIFKVPVCAGFLPGQLLVEGSLVVDGKVYKVKAPPLRFEGGVANYGNISLTFDTKNMKVLPGWFNNNIEKVLSFKARLQSRLDGVLALDNPLNVVTEFGKVTLKDNGMPNEKGVVEFDIEALNLGANRPVRITDPAISNGGRYDYQCSPEQFTTSSAYPDPISYATLSKDWRSTALYYVMGQEEFFDANHNGIFDKFVKGVQGSTGFWDKNQNGVFDCTDDGICDITTAWTDINGVADATKVGKKPSACATATTFPACTAGEVLSVIDEAIAYTWDWFIDEPSPFVDANENGGLDSTTIPNDLAEIVVGESFLPPNGQWDNQNYIWKSFVMPVHVGMSVYSVSHRIINNDILRTFYTNRLTGEDDMDPTKKGLSKYFKDLGYARTLWDTTATPIDQKAGVANTLFTCMERNPHTTAYDCSGPEIIIPTPVPVNDATNNIPPERTLPFNGDAGSRHLFGRYLFAQGTTGSPLPGGSTLTVTFESAISEASVWGARPISAHFGSQPGDATKEPSRHFLSKATGSNAAIIGMDPSGHPIKNYSYPVEFFVEVAPCMNVCTGTGVRDPGFACSADAKWIHLDIEDGITKDGLTLTSLISIPEYVTCSCKDNFIFVKGVCQEPL